MLRRWAWLFPRRPVFLVESRRTIAPAAGNQELVARDWPGSGHLVKQSCGMIRLPCCPGLAGLRRPFSTTTRRRPTWFRPTPRRGSWGGSKMRSLTRSSGTDNSNLHGRGFVLVVISVLAVNSGSGSGFPVQAIRGWLPGDSGHAAPMNGRPLPRDVMCASYSPCGGSVRSDGLVRRRAIVAGVGAGLSAY
jgi:hypothetical protein